MNMKQLLHLKHYSWADFDSFEDACNWCRNKFHENAVEHDTLASKPPKHVSPNGHWRDEECLGSSDLGTRGRGAGGLVCKQT